MTEQQESKGDEKRRKARHVSTNEKYKAVVRQLGGESSSTVALDLRVTVERVEDWKARFVSAGMEALQKSAHQKGGLYAALAAHSKVIGQWAGLLLVLAIAIVFLVRFMGQGGGE